jgi:uncharacterized protein
MNIKVLDRNSNKTIYYSPSQFQLLMGCEYIPLLEFSSNKVLRDAKRWSQQYAKYYLNDKEDRWQQAYLAKEIRSGYVVDTSIGWIDDDIGYGLITNQDIQEQSFIGEYTGVVRRKTEIYFSSNDYIWEMVPPPCSIPVLKDYMSCCIDAKPKGNYTRFINHSNDNNLETQYILCDDILHVCFTASKFIPAGTQLTYHYGPKYWKKRKKKQDLL